MPSDAEFLAAIRQHPEDATLRPSYARWLRAQGDGRAELIEIEERARALAVDSDTYWKLKPSRNAARKACDPVWLETLGYLTCRPVLGGPGDIRSRFRLIRELLEQWHGVELGDVGRVSDECADIEQRLGAPLPLAVREWLALASDLSRTGVIGPEGALGHVRKHFKPELGGIALSQVVHEAGGSVCVVRFEDSSLDDPPVQCWVEDVLEGESWWDDDLPSDAKGDFVLLHFDTTFQAWLAHPTASNGEKLASWSTLAAGETSKCAAAEDDLRVLLPTRNWLRWRRDGRLAPGTDELLLLRWNASRVCLDAVEVSENDHFLTEQDVNAFERTVAELAPTPRASYVQVEANRVTVTKERCELVTAAH